MIQRLGGQLPSVNVRNEMSELTSNVVSSVFVHVDVARQRAARELSNLHEYKSNGPSRCSKNVGTELLLEAEIHFSESAASVIFSVVKNGVDPHSFRLKALASERAARGIVKGK